MKKCASTVGDQIILLVEGLSDGGHEQLAEIVIIIKGVRLVFVLSYDYFSKEEMNENNKHVIEHDATTLQTITNSSYTDTASQSMVPEWDVS